MRIAPKTPLNLGAEPFSFPYKLILYKDYLCNMPSFVNSILIKALCLAIQFLNTCMKLEELKFFFKSYFIHKIHLLSYLLICKI